MKNYFIKNYKLVKKNQKGYAILFTIVVVSAISVITAGLTNAAYKQLILSSLAKDSQSAFYQSDTAGDCALYADRKNPSGILTTGGPWTCGGADLNVTPLGGGSYTIYPADEDLLTPCFRIDVTKTSTSSTPDWQSNLISWWRLNGDASDSIGGNDGTVTGATSTSTNCQSEQCYTFDGNDDYIEAPNSTSLDISGDQVSISVWFRTNINSETIMLVSKPASSSTHTSPYFSYNIQQYGGGTNDYPRMWISTSNNPTGVSTSYTGDVLEAGQLYHVVGVYNGSQICTYLNGTLLGSCTSVTGNLISYNTPLRIGVNGGYTEDFNGLVDEVMIWNRALSSTEVGEVYNYSFGGNVVQTEISAKGYNICRVNNIRTVEREIQINYEEEI